MCCQFLGKKGSRTRNLIKATGATLYTHTWYTSVEGARGSQKQKATRAKTGAALSAGHSAVNAEQRKAVALTLLCTRDAPYTTRCCTAPSFHCCADCSHAPDYQQQLPSAKSSSGRRCCRHGLPPFFVPCEVKKGFGISMVFSPVRKAQGTGTGGSGGGAYSKCHNVSPRLLS